MPIITVEGRVGAGAPDLGRLVARELEIDFVDRLILAQIARRANATMRALVDQERRVPSLVNRFSSPRTARPRTIRRRRNGR